MRMLSVIRILADVNVKLISELLNVSTYAYIGFESGDRIIPKEIPVMISKIYNIDESVLYSEEVTEEMVSKLNMIGNMEAHEKKKYLAYNLLGENVKISYHSVNKVKKTIKKQID